MPSENYEFRSAEQAELAMRFVLLDFHHAHILVREEDVVPAIHHQVEESGRPSIWVDLAGMSSVGELTQALWQQAIDLYGWERFSQYLDLIGAWNSSVIEDADTYLADTLRVLSALSEDKQNLIVTLNGAEYLRQFRPPLSISWVGVAYGQWNFKFIAIEERVHHTAPLTFDPRYLYSEEAKENAAEDDHADADEDLASDAETPPLLLN